ncbi:hypothetical protein GUJ93_ZPchr0007g5652 [Zizania palustris]|uniref:Uncharacterized protein n=1 Tax=Zizania palustris TaxID=103762 RepID=A0A8J5VEF7_ZIZPA|nr:hypothetical protein GUJ93_ZPchr0935g33594 [Zizania palustris]KAG8080127.1 hypothetical protein GUJ93_ZPchr0007g5652 [Zizania palustris]
MPLRKNPALKLKRNFSQTNSSSSGYLASVQSSQSISDFTALMRLLDVASQATEPTARDQAPFLSFFVILLIATSAGFRRESNKHVGFTDHCLALQHHLVQMKHWQKLELISHG